MAATSPSRIVPSRSALLIMDFQNAARPYGTQPTVITACLSSQAAAPIPTLAYTKP